MVQAKIKAQWFGQVHLIHAESIAEAKKLVTRNFLENKLRLSHFEMTDTNLYFCSTKKRTRNESYYVYVVLDSTKYTGE